MHKTQYIAAVRIVKTLVKHGYEAVFAGGCVRNMLLGLDETEDIDIATSAPPQTVASLFDRVSGIGEHFGVMLVIEDSIPFEVATFRSDIGTYDGRRPQQIAFSSQREDAQRRDFTINGLFFDPLSETVHDFVGGEKDLRAGIVRAIGNPAHRFEEDYLRLLRAVRFAARFEFEIEPQTRQAMKRHAQGIQRISAERIFQELNKMLTGPHADRAISLLSDSKLLAEVLPEVEALKGVEQPPQFHPEGDVYAHTLKALSLLKRRTPCAAWSTLLHDIGKPPTMTRTDRIRFNNHHHVGSAMARRALRRLKASRALIDSVSEIIEHHMDFMNVRKMRLSTLKKFLGRPTFEDEMELHRIDCLASHGDLENYTFLREKHSVLTEEHVKPQPLLRGRDLIALGLKPGPRFGQILGEAYDLQLEEKLRTREEAIEWLRAKIELQ